MRASTVVAILCLAAEVALSVALPLPASKYASLSCCIYDAQILSFADLLSVPVGAREGNVRARACLGSGPCFRVFSRPLNPIYYPALMARR